MQYALRGQAEAPVRLTDMWYRERFGLSQKDFEDEPADVYNYNVSVMRLEEELKREDARREELNNQRMRGK